MKEEKKDCLRCKKILDDYPAISRRDNKTPICSNCGREEALFDFLMAKKKVTSEEIKQEKLWLLKLGTDELVGSGGF